MATKAAQIHTAESIKALMAKGPVALEGVSEAVYHGFFAMSNSGMREFKKAPGYWKWSRENPSEDTASRKLYRLVHMAIGEPNRFETEVVQVAGHRGGKEVKAEIAQWEELGKTVVKPEQFMEAVEIAAYCRKHELIKAILKNGTGERSLFWFDPETGVPCKARLDWTTETDFINDWKNFDAVWDDEELERHIRTSQYHFQAAWYLEAFFQVYGRPAKGFTNTFLRHGPCDAAVREIDKETIATTHPIIRNHLRNFAECIKKNEWPMTPPLLGEIILKPFWS